MAANKKIALFLGAGASAPYGKPVTTTIREDLRAKYKEKANAVGLGMPEGVLYSFLFNREFEDIEDVLESISEWALFVKKFKYAKRYWSGLGITMRLVVEGRETGFDLVSFVDRINSAKRLIEDEVFTAYRWDHDQDQKLQSIYFPLFEAILGQTQEIHVFTTNYDRAIETFCINHRKKYQFIDGFAHNQETGYSQWSGTYEDIAKSMRQDTVKVYLYKIHGSLDWKRHKMHGVVRTGEESRSSDPNFEQNMVIFPTRSPKEDATLEPYASILKRMANFGKEADCFIVIGYSFRDDNINQVFHELLRTGKQIIVISKTAKAHFMKGIVKEKLHQESQTKMHFIENRIEKETVTKIIDEIKSLLSYRQADA